MSCYHPLKAWKIGVNFETGKDKLKITSYDVKYLYKPFNSNVWHYGYDNYSKYYQNVVDEFIEIPCGKCIGCRLKYSLDWATRCMLEAKYHEDNWFLTLTYNDDHLPEKRVLCDENGDALCDENGEVFYSPYNSLYRRDVQRFMKNLRKRIYPEKVRFYGCGEYGTKFGRPHYHLILFGLKLDDLQPISISPLGHKYYTSEIIKSCWVTEKEEGKKPESLGFHKIGACTFETCAYVARYVTKKHKGIDSDVYKKLCYEPEFTMMSRKPGIGFQYYEDNKIKIYENQEIFLSLRDGVKRVRPPVYYDRLYDIDYPSDYAGIKAHRKELAETSNLLKQNLTTKSYLDRLETEELYHNQRIKRLKERSVGDGS